jgi:hypothetical protein
MSSIRVSRDTPGGHGIRTSNLFRIADIPTGAAGKPIGEGSPVWVRHCRGLPNDKLAPASRRRMSF